MADDSLFYGGGTRRPRSRAYLDDPNYGKVFDETSGQYFDQPLGTTKTFEEWLSAGDDTDPNLFEETRGMSPQQFVNSPYSMWAQQPGGELKFRGMGEGWQNPTWIPQEGDVGSQGFLKSFATRGLPYFGAALGAGALLGGVPALSNWTNLFTGAADGGGSAAGLFGSGGDIALPWEHAAGGSLFDPGAIGGAESLASYEFPESIGGDWLQNLVSDPSVAEGGAVTEGIGGDAVNNWLDFMEEYPGGGSMTPDYSGIPDVPDFPSSAGGEYPPVGGPMRGAGAGSGPAIPEWARRVADAIGVSPASIGRIIAGTLGGAGQARQGSQQIDVAKQQRALSEPSRARFEAMSAAPPGSWRKTDPTALLNSAASAMGKQWSMREGNPADSPRAIRSTERDLAKLLFEIQEADLAAEHREKQLQANTGGLTRTSPDAPYAGINVGRDLQTRGVSGALGTILGEIFNPKTDAKSTEETIVSLMLQFPELFGRR